MISQEPPGTSTVKNRPIADNGAGSTRYTPTVDTNSRPARIFVDSSTAA